MAGAEAPVEDSGPPRVKFDGDDPRAYPDQRSGQRPGTRPEIDDEIGLADAGSVYDVASRPVIETVVAPANG